jgi:hypothetical protein
LGNGPEDDEIRVEETLELGVLEKLLTQQFTAPSRVGVKIDKDFFVFGFCLGQGLVEGPGEEDLGRSRGGEDEDKKSRKEFLHGHLFSEPEI